MKEKFNVCTSEHSMIFLMGPEPWSNPVFSWFREEVLQERSRFRNVLKKFFLHISSLRLVAFRSVHPFLQGSPFCPPPNPMLCNVLVDWTLLESASSTILATRCTICTRFLGHTQVHITNRFSCSPAVVVGSTPTNVRNVQRQQQSAAFTQCLKKRPSLFFQ